MRKQEITRRGGNSGMTAHRMISGHKTGLLRIAVSLCLCLVLFFGMIPGKANASEGQDPDEKKASDAQLASLDPTKPGEGYSAILYNARNGLPTSEANAIVETEEGFIWIGSYSGLIRYDGNTFERVDSTSGIASVVSLFVDSKNRLWIGTNDGGVFVMDKGETKAFRREEGLKSLSVRAIAEDIYGNIYVATTRGVAEINTAMNVRTIDQVLIRDEYIRDLKLGKDGLVYGITQDGAMFTLEKGVLKEYFDLPGEKITGVISVFPDPYRQGFVYLGTDSSTVYYVDITANTKVYKPIDVAPLSYINSVVSIEGTLWFCARNGIGLMENGNLRLLDNVPVHNAVEKMIGDYQNNLWFVSSRQGVMKITPNRFADVFDWYNFEPTVVNSTCTYNDFLLFGTDTGLIVVDEQKEVTKWGIHTCETASGKPIDQTDIIKMLSGVRIRSIIRDSKNRIWFSTYSDYGLICYERGLVTCYTLEDGMPSKRVRTIHECKDGSIWAACTGGMVVIRDGELKKTYSERDGLINTEVLTVEESPDGECVLGTDGGGIYIIGSGMMRCVDTSSGLTSDVVMRVKWDEVHKVYWVVTSNSLAYLDQNFNLTTVNSFPYSNNFDIYANNRGEMWILSSNGVYVISADELLQNNAEKPVLYDWNKGLPYVATANSYSELTDDGTLYISGGEGVARVNIEEPFGDVSELKVAVPFVEADGEFVYPDEKGNFRIKADVKKVAIYAYVYTYSMTNPQVTFWLEGFDHMKTTVKRTELTPLYYTNLHGKKYVFQMEVRDSKGLGSIELSVVIIKNKMFYEYWWFMVLAIIAAIILVGFAVWMFVRRKIKNLEKKEAEQKAFINEVIEAFAKTIDMKDSYTNGHSFRVAKYTAMLATELGYNEEDVEKFHNIALLHDIGKIGVEDKVLKKEGKLTDEEFAQIKSHASLGYGVLKDISIMPELATGAGAHHERPDGKGYPNGLKGDEIPRVAQIIGVADCFDAMYSDRPYRKRMNFEKAVSIIKGAAGTQLTADVVDAFLRLVDKGEFRAPDDDGTSGTTEDIDNIHKKAQLESAEQNTVEKTKE